VSPWGLERPAPPDHPEEYAAVKRLRQSLFNATRHTSGRTRLLVVAAILGAVFVLIRPDLPAAVRVSYRLAPGIRSLAVDYEQGGAVVRAARFAWEVDASPTTLRHEPELAAGPTRIVMTWHDHEGVRRTSRRTVQVAADRVVHVDLRPDETRRGTPETL
jgi:hypothetical protein